jgi:hypothetical protein
MAVHEARVWASWMGAHKTVLPNAGPVEGTIYAIYRKMVEGPGSRTSVMAE